MRTLLLIIPAMILAATPADAESLWRRAGRDARNLYADQKARRVGDLVTVIIQETASITKEKDAEYKKSSETDLEIELFRLLGLDSVSHPRAAGDTPALKWRSNRTFKGEADSSTTETFNKTMAAMVTDVLPNGNLIIEGSSDIVTDDDITTVTVTGTIRRNDITLANTVSSQKIFNARINYQGKGPLKQNTRRGWAGRFFDAIWPF